jgi:hypothetical protein
VLRDWLAGLLAGPFEQSSLDRRVSFGRRLVESEWTFDDIILLEGLMRGQLLALAQRKLGDDPHELSATIQTMNKALCLDLMLIYSGYLRVRNDEIERSLLDRFLSITGFSRTLYDNLAEARGLSRQV